MSMFKQKPPSAPDFNQAVQNQFATGQQAIDQQTQTNRPDQTNAFGASSNWTQGPDGQWTQQTSFGGPLGGAVGGLEQQIADQGPLGNGDWARNQAIDAAYKQSASRLDPQWSQREESLRAQLANQGLDPGSEAYGHAMGDFSRDRNDAYSSAMNGAIGQGTAAQQATFGENLAAQMAPYQQLGALSGLTGQQGFNAAGANQAAQYLPAAVAQYGGDLQTYGTQQQAKNSTMGGFTNMLGTVGAAALSRGKG